MLSKTPGNQQFKSRIEEINSDNIVCAMPMIKGRPLIIQAGIKIYVKAIIDNSVYLFSSKILDKKISPLPVWVIEVPSNVERIQQRSFVRIDVALPSEVSLVGNDETDDKIVFETITKDISGGGARLILNQSIEDGTKLSMTIKLPDENILVNGEVIRSEKPDADRNLFWVGVKFTDINEPARNKLIKFIFKKQLEQRQRGV